MYLYYISSRRRQKFRPTRAKKNYFEKGKEGQGVIPPVIKGLKVGKYRYCEIGKMLCRDQQQKSPNTLAERHKEKSNYNNRSY